MSLLASFSGKLYGLRSHKNKKGIKDNELLEQIQTINDLEELLGEAKLAELFMQHYIKLVGDKLHISEDLKDVDLFNLE